IHREDIEFDLNDQNVIYTASQGQKRMILLAFKLSLMKFAESKSGKVPVLLLDDVLSELDMTRQKNLIREIYGKCQSIITSTDYPEFLKDYQIREFRITHGTVTEYNGGK
ncbi:MAG: DNA replication and repair protein RecF, partial [Erysipelotrichaceae bacterium]|nr:DNA replication and repair protein RecF [Erysipelotrichaceae bacterium]